MRPADQTKATRGSDPAHSENIKLSSGSTFHLKRLGPDQNFYFFLEENHIFRFVLIKKK